MDDSTPGRCYHFGMVLQNGSNKAESEENGENLVSSSLTSATCGSPGVN